jgi:putative flippase GtrA
VAFKYYGEYILIKKYLNREIMSYISTGFATTVINYLVYLLCRYSIGTEYVALNTTIAWFFAVLFAYISNRLWVFKSSATTTPKIALELAAFFGSRLLTGLLDVAFMKILVDGLGENDLWMKLFVNVFVTITNYFIAKKIIFKNKEEAKI